MSKRDYTKEAVEAARSVLLEVMHVLGAFQKDIAVVGGLVPDFIIPGKPFVGSLDIDLALNHKNLTDVGYKTICELLLDRGYIQQKDKPFTFLRNVPVNDGAITVAVDLLSGEYEGTGKSHRHQKIQDTVARKARGCDLVFEVPAIEIELRGELPGGGIDSAIIKVASVVPFVVMKSMALGDRLKEKDAWDIYFVLRNYPSGPDAIVKEFEPYSDHGLVKEGLKILCGKFESEKHAGPKMVADFAEIEDQEERERIQRDSFEHVNFLLEKLGVLKP